MPDILQQAYPMGVNSGGTGKTTVTLNSYLKGNGTGALVERTYAEVLADLGLSDPLRYMGVIDCAANPNYPAADAGNCHIISVAGKIGGASGVVVAAGDMIICKTDGTVTGDQAAVGSAWNVIEKNIDLTNIVISGGTIDGVTLGGTTPVKLGLNPTVGAFSEGKLYYDQTWKTVTAEIGRDISLQIGQEDIRRVYNNSGVSITDGQAVYTTGVGSDGVGGPTVATVALAQANSFSTSYVLGVATQSIPSGSYGMVTVRGNINSFDTTSFGNAGDVLYLSATTAGLLTNTAPDAPNFEVRIGRLIVKDASSGRINVRIAPATRLTDLADVTVSGAVSGQLLKFDGVSWVPADSSSTVGPAGTDFFLTDSDANIEGMTRANPCIVTWTGHGMTGAGNKVKFEGITQAGWTALNSPSGTSNVFHTATIINENSFSIPVNTTGYAADYVPASDPGTISHGSIQNTPITTIAESIDSAQSTGDVEALIEEYATPSALGRTTIEGGEWVFNTWCYASSLTDTNIVVIRVYKRTVGGVETELFNVSTADLGTTNVLSVITSLQPSFSVLATDYLVVKYYAKSNRTGSQYRTIYITHNGTTHYSYFRTPMALSHNQLGSLYGESPYYHLSAADYTGTGTGVMVRKTSPVLLGNVGIGEATPIGKQQTLISATTPLIAGGATVGSYTSCTFPTANKDYVNKTGIGTASTVGDLVVITGGTGAYTGIYSVYAIIGANSIQLNRACHASGTDIVDGAVSISTAPRLVVGTNRTYHQATLANATSNEAAFRFDYTTNKATSGNDTGIQLNFTDTASPGTSLLVDLQKAGVSQFSITDTGGVTANNITLSDSGNITLDTSPAGDHAASGIISSETVGENVVFGELLYRKSDGKLWKADADQATTMPGMRLALATISADAAGLCLAYGAVRDDSWAWTIGGLIFASTTSGGLTQTAPTGDGDQVQIVGVATSATNMFFYPSPVIVEVGLTVEAFDTGHTITTTELSGIPKTFTCNSGSDQVFTAPSVDASNVGLKLTIIKLGAGKVTFTTVDSDTVSDSSAPGTIYCSDAGIAVLNLVLATSTQWIVTSATGTWTTT